MARVLRALRGATTIEVDSTEQINERVQALIRTLLERNGVEHEDIVSIIFTATEDVTAVFPAAAARAIGLGDVPLLCARELSIRSGTPHCIRVLVHLYTDRERQALHHVYLEGARGLRDDLPD
ncbi:MAG: chorismate mutase [Acidimicrobiales bacterium]